MKKIIAVILAFVIAFSNAGFAGAAPEADETTLSPYLNAKLVDASGGRSIFLETFEEMEARAQAARWVDTVVGLRQAGVLQLSWDDALAELESNIRAAASGNANLAGGIDNYIEVFSAEFLRLAALQDAPVVETTEQIVSMETAAPAANGNKGIEWLSPETATQRIQELSILGNDARLKDFCERINKEALDAGREPDYAEFIDSLRPELAVVKDVLSRTRPADELTKLEKDGGVKAKELDILRSTSELVLQLLEKRKGVDNTTRLGQIKSAFVRHTDISKLMIEYFEQRFDPAKKVEKGKFGKTRNAIDNMINSLEPGDDKDALSDALTILAAVLRTNYFVEDRASLFMKIAPSALLKIDKQGALAGDTPMFLLWVHIPYGGFGAHIRYNNFARGGMRSIHWSRTESLNSVLAEAAGLAETQEVKHMSIPDGGSKGTYINAKDLQDIAVFAGYVEGLLDSMIYDDTAIRRKRSDTVQAEPLKLGPDERTGKDGYADLAKLLAYMKHVPGWQSIMTGAAVMGGIPHKLNNLAGRDYNRVTSQGVMTHYFLMADYLIETGRITLEDNRPIVLPVTGGPEGDVAGGIVDIAVRHYGDGVLIPSFNDVTGVVLAPKNGIPHAVLTRLYEKDAAGEKGAFAKDISASELGEGGVVVPVKPAEGEDAYFELGPEILQYLNTRPLDPKELERLGVEGKFKEIAKLAPDQPLVIVMETDPATKHPIRVRVNRQYLQTALIFIARGDLAATGFAHRYVIDDKTWPLFLGWDGKPVATGIVHGANVVATPAASIALEKAGVVIEPDEKANSVGVEVSDAEVNMNTVFDLFTEVTRKVKAAFLVNRVDASREWARRKFFALQIESKARPGASVVTNVSVDMSLAVSRYKDLIEKSDLVGDKRDDFSPAVMAYLERHFPEVDRDSGGKYASTIDRVFDRMPSYQIKGIAARKIAEDIILNLGEADVEMLAKGLGVRSLDIIRAYVEVAYNDGLNDKIRAIVGNDDIPCNTRIDQLIGIRGSLKRSILAELASVSNAITVMRSSMQDVSRHLQLRNLKIGKQADTRPIAVVMRQGLPEILTGDGRVIAEAMKSKYGEMEQSLRAWIGGNITKVSDEAALTGAVNDFIARGYRVVVMDADDGVLTKGADINGVARGEPHRQNYCMIKLQKRDSVEALDKLSAPFVNLNAAALMGKGMLDSDERLFAKAYRLFAGKEASDRLIAGVYQGRLWILKVMPRIVQFSVEDLRQREELRGLFEAAA